MSLRFKFGFILLGVLAVAGNGCSKTNGSISAQIRIAGASGASLRADEKELLTGLQRGGFSMLSADDVGMSGVSDLTALKYKIFSIVVCENLTVSGTGFSGADGCLTIYDSGTSGPTDPTWGYDSTTITSPTVLQAMAATFVANESSATNLMDATSRAALTTSVSVTSSDARSYNWGIINWYPTIMVQGQVDLGGGVTLRTKGDGAINSQGKWITTSSMTSGTAGKAIVSTGNGGTWFRFQNPLVISADAVSRGEAFTVDLAFNPDGYSKGVNATTWAGCGTCSIGDSSNNWMTVPMLDITPIPHTASQTVRRETYTAVVDGATEDYTIRLQLYYLSGDSARTIYGVNTNTVITSTSSKFVYDFPKVSFISTNGDGTLSFKLWDNSVKLIDNFTRQTTVGGTTTATIHCGGNALSGGFITTDCPDGSSMAVTFTLDSDAAF